MKSIPSTAVFTIIANNYGAQARVLLRSLRSVQPEWKRFVLIVDVPAKESPVPADLGHVLHPDQLKLSNPSWFAMYYNVLEANTAVKPLMIEYLFNKGFDRVVYLDPDIKAYSAFREVEEILDSAELVLTPHITQPYPDTATPNTIDIRKAGIYNLGFVAMRPSEHTRRLLSWWQNCCREDCRVAFDEHIFVDQSWMDFAPPFVPATHILHHTGYNVAYWNIHERSVNCSGYPDAVPKMQDGSPLRFFHFSGYDPAHPDRLSKHQTRIPDGTWPAWLTTLFQGYCSDLVREGWRSKRGMLWRLNPLADLPLPEPLRQAVLREPSIRGAFLRPMSARKAKSLALKFLTGPDRIYQQLPVYMAELYRARPDLRSKIPDRDPLFISKVIAWFKNTGREEFCLNHEWPADGWWNFRKKERVASRKAGKPRINLYGYFTEFSQEAESARGCVRALRGRELLLRPINIAKTAPNESISGDFQPELPLSNPTIDIVQIKKPLRSFFAAHPEVSSSGSYKIAYWDGDLDPASPEVDEISSAFNEIWCHSRSSRAVLKQRFSGPVRVVWPNVNPGMDGISHYQNHAKDCALEQKCVFLTLLDCSDSPERQNTAGAVKAYLDAFPEPIADHLLVVGVANASMRLDYLENLEHICAGRKDVVLVQEGSRWKLFRTLIGPSSALISLRSSGDSLIESVGALSLGKYVIHNSSGTDELGSRRCLRVQCGLSSAGFDGSERYRKTAGAAIRSIYQQWSRQRLIFRNSEDPFRRRSLRTHRIALKSALKRAQYRKSRTQREKQLTAVIFGAGSAGELLVQSIGPLYKILAFADNDPKKAGQRIGGYRIVGATDIRKLAPDRILIASIYWKEIQSQLMDLGYPAEKMSVAANTGF
jgi:hypothetical protein